MEFDDDTLSSLGYARELGGYDDDARNVGLHAIGKVFTRADPKPRVDRRIAHRRAALKYYHKKMLDPAYRESRRKPKKPQCFPQWRIDWAIGVCVALSILSD